MQRQPEPTESLRKDGHQPLGVIEPPADDDGIVGVADQFCRSVQARLHLFDKPPVQHVVQV